MNSRESHAFSAEDASSRSHPRRRVAVALSSSSRPFTSANSSTSYVYPHHLTISCLLTLLSSCFIPASAAISAPFYRLPEAVIYVGQASFRGLNANFPPPPPSTPSPPPPASSVLPPPSAPLQARQRLLSEASSTSQEIVGAASSVHGGGVADQHDRRVDWERKRTSATQQARSLRTAGVSNVNTTTLRVASRLPRNLARGFEGTTVKKVRYSGVGPVYNNTGAITNPPDVDLCVGNGFIVQTTNGGIGVYDTNGRVKARVLSMNQFLRLNPAWRRLDNGTILQGDRVADPSCTYDKETRRFFYTAFWRPGPYQALLDRMGQTRVDASGRFGSGTIVAASSRGNPLLPWSVYFIRGTNDGINSHNDTAPPLNYTGPSDLQDFPHTTVDSHGVYISNNQFLRDGGQPGANIYVLSKQKLISKPSSFEATRLALPFPEAGIHYRFTLRPAKVPADGSYDLRADGTVYFMSIPFDSATIETGNTLALYILSNTASLTTGKGSLKFQMRIVATPSYPFFNKGYASQKDGPIPWGTSLDPSNVPANLDADGLRMHAVAWAAGRLWFAFSASFGANETAGIIYGAIRPIVGTPRRPSSLPPVKVVFEQMQLIGVPGQNLIWPGISANSAGNGILSFALVGPDFYPSAAFAIFNSQGLASTQVFVAAWGRAPLDSATGYPSTLEDRAVTRYGDWHTATMDEFGRAWAAVEYVTKDRLPNFNWGTYIVRVNI